jgi:hypothetical protein
MIKLHAYAVAAHFGDGDKGFIACCPYVASEATVASAQAVALIKDETKTPYPLVAVHVIELPPEWLRSALQHIEASAAVEEKPKVLHLVPAPHQLKAATGGTSETIVPNANAQPKTERPEMGGDLQHSLACPRRWGGWGNCRCGAA